MKTSVITVSVHFEENDLAMIKSHYGLSNYPSKDDLKHFVQVAVDSLLNLWYEQEGQTNGKED